MNYKERYEQVLERAREAKENTESAVTIGILEEVFPELKESEDELMWLTKYIEEEAYSLSMDIRDNEDSIKLKKLQKALAWLEKQGEQKPANKIEPKFQNGQWIVWQNKCYKVNYNGCGYELIDQNGLRTSLEYGTVDESAHLWTIQDAKDGDILVSGFNKPFIYNGKHNSMFVGAYGGITTIDEFMNAKEECHWTDNMNIHPATKEQRELLFQKMEKAGYEWSSEHRKLNQS